MYTKFINLKVGKYYFVKYFSKCFLTLRLRHRTKKCLHRKKKIISQDVTKGNNDALTYYRSVNGMWPPRPLYCDA